METLDIKALLLNIKDNISLIEKRFLDESILREIEDDFLNLLELLKLFLISKRDVYYGYFMMNMSYKANFYVQSIAGIKLNTYPPVFESNPLLLCKYNLKEILFIICHEIEHVIFNHPAEMVKVNPQKLPEVYERFNLAADASVNDRLIDEINTYSYKFMTMPEGCITSEYLRKEFKLKSIRKCESYKYYYDLIKVEEDNENQQQMMINKLLGEEGKFIESEDGYPCIVSNSNNIKDHDWEVEDDEYEAIKENTKEFINQSYEMISKENRGTMPGLFIQEIEKINQPTKISWQSILKKYIGTISASYKKTRTRLNRRQPQRFDLSGKINDKTLKIVVALDTSGSVSDRDISYIFNEIFSIISKKNYELTIIECDAEIQKVYKVKKPSDIQMKVAGRGGTCFTPVIEYINNDRYYRDSLLIYFTDGYGENKIPKPLTYRNLWVILGKKNELSLKEPYGTVVEMNIYGGEINE